MTTSSALAPTLSQSDLETFMRDGYTAVRGAFPRDVAAQLATIVCHEAGISQTDPKTWTKCLAVVPKNLTGPLWSAIYSPRLVSALDQLLGAGRYHLPDSSGYMLVNLPGFQSPPWQMIGGHIDGSHFHHHVYSREQGLIMLYIFTDNPPQGGGTAVCPGSHRRFARVLAASEPKGMTSPETCEAGKIVSADITPIELQASAGDVLIMHPFLFHGSSSNLSGKPRLASNMCVFLREHMNLKRENPADYSVVERVIVEALAEKAS